MNKTTQTILVTGVSGGLGYETAFLLLDQGYEVIGISRGSKVDVLNKLEQAAKDKKTSFEHISINLENPQSVKESVTQIEADTISHAIFCHGVNFNVSLSTLDWETIEKSLRINFGGSFLLAQHLFTSWTRKKNQGDKSLVYISSVAGKTASPTEIAYHSAKRAMEAAMYSFAREGALYGIRSNVISPGLMDTQMGKETIKNKPDVLSRIPLKRLTGVTEIARAILFLITSESTTGQNFHINGGRYFTI